MAKIVHIHKNHVIHKTTKQSFSQPHRKYLKWDRKFQMNPRLKLLHLDVPAYLAGPAHLIWTTPKTIYKSSTILATSEKNAIDNWLSKIIIISM